MKSRPFEQLFSVGTGFCMGFLKSSKTDHNPFLFKNRKYKAKVAQIKRFKRLMLELLGRFELPTSSLPTTAEPSSPCCIRLCGVFLSKKDEVAACLFHCFHPHVSPWGSRCGSSGNFCIKEAADRLHRHIRFASSSYSFYRFSLIINSGALLNESLLLLAGFRP